MSSASRPKYVRVGLAHMDEAGGNIKIHKLVELEFPNPIRIQFARSLLTTAIFSP